MPDRELDALLARAAAGDREAADTLVRGYRDVLQAALHRRLGQALQGRVETEDLVQSTFAVAIKDLGSFENRGEGAFLAWLLKIAENRARMAARFHRAERRDVGREARVTQMDGRLHGGVGTPSRIASLNEDQDRLRWAMDGLRETDREVVRLRSFEGLPFRDIAQRLDLDSEDAARHRYSRAVKRLADLLDDGSDA